MTETTFTVNVMSTTARAARSFASTSSSGFQTTHVFTFSVNAIAKFEHEKLPTLFAVRLALPRVGLAERRRDAISSQSGLQVMVMKKLGLP